MRYKIVVTFPELETAEKILKLLQESKVYKSPEIMSICGIQEVCNECVRREK